MHWSKYREMILTAAVVMQTLITTKSHAATITVGTAVGPPGGTVAIDVTLAARAREEIAGAQSDMLFDSTLVDLAPRACIINSRISNNEEINPECGDFPPGAPCKSLNSGLEDIDGDQRRFRGLILSLSNTNPITAPGTSAVLYTCTLTIASTARQDSRIDLRCDNAGASDPDGVALETSCEDGLIIVGTAAATPTRTATPTQSPQATITPLPERSPATPTPQREAPTSSPAPTRTPVALDDVTDRGGSTSGSAFGCQITPGETSHASWLIILIAILLRCSTPRTEVRSRERTVR